MARLKFFKGAISGRLGEIVGASWKGINYIRTFTAPSNPKSESQTKVRVVFKAISAFASALFSKGLLALIPSARRVTARNSVFIANRQMIADKLFTPEALQIARSNYDVNIPSFGCNASLSDGTFNFDATMYLTDGSDGVGLTAHCLVYDFVKGVIVAYAKEEVISPISPTSGKMLPQEAVLPDSWNTPAGSQKADCVFMCFVTGLNSNNEKIISQTFATNIS